MLGRTDVRLTELGFGAAPLGNLYRKSSREAALGAVEAAWDEGMRYYDTAPFYGFGLSERRVGDILRLQPREDFVLSTKVGRLLKPVSVAKNDGVRHGYQTSMPFEPHYDYTYDGVMRSFEDSQQRLGMDKIDILLAHDIGVVTHGDENGRHFTDLENGGYKALDELRRSGHVKAIGLGVNEWEVCEAVMQFGQWDCFLLAGRYTLLEQGAMASFMPKCKAHGAGLIIGGAFNSGILATGVRKGGELFYNYAPAPQEIIDRVSRLESICDDHGVTLAAAALQFPLAHELVATVLPGVESAERVKQAMQLFAEPIPASFWSDLKAAGCILQEVPTP